MASSTFRFLELPGELRNEVYYHLFPREIKKIIHLDDIRSAASNTTTGTYAGITRVCKQLRAETLPLQQGDLRVVVRCQDLPKFFETFCSQTVSVRMLSVSVSPRDFGFRTESIDILPLLRALFSGANPLFTCWIVYTDPISGYSFDDRRATQSLNKFLVHSDPNWLSLLRQEKCQFDAVLLNIASKSVEIVLKRNLQSKLRFIDLSSQEGIHGFLRAVCLMHQGYLTSEYSPWNFSVSRR